MTIKTATKIVVLFILFNVIVIPVWVWAIGQFIVSVTVDMSGMAAFLAASGVPIGALMGFMMGRGISRDRVQAQQNTT
jgi:membrane associated rhomboid family serine protease